MTGLLHDIHHAIETYTVAAVTERSVKLSIERAGGGKSIALDAWDLH